MKENRASETAQLIALATLMLAADPARRHLVAPGAEEYSNLFLQLHPRSRRLARWFQTSLGRRLWGLVEGLAWPGITEHFWRRKNWIEARVRAALAEGWERVVVPGAGLDTLALRLAPEFPAVDFVELDHPATRRLKLKALASAQYQTPPNLRFLEADLTRAALPAELSADRKSSFVVAEGLLMYLPPATVREFLGSVADLARPRLVFSFMRNDRVLGSLVQLKLKLRGEPFLWSAEPAELPAFLAECGLAVRAHVTGATLADAVRGTPFQGEDLAECERLS